MGLLFEIFTNEQSSWRFSPRFSREFATPKEKNYFWQDLENTWTMAMQVKI